MVREPALGPRRLAYVGLGALAGASVGLRHTIGPVLGVVLLAVVAVLVVERFSDGDGTLRTLLLATFAVRFGVVALDVWLGWFPKVDAASFHAGSVALADAVWHGGVAEAVAGMTIPSYEVVPGSLYAWFGPWTILARTFNVLLATLAAYNVFRIGRTVFDRRSGLMAAGVFAFLPSLVRVHGEHLREALVVLLVTEVVYLLLAERFATRRGAVPFLGALAWLALLRGPTFAVILVPTAMAGVHLVHHRTGAEDRGAGMSRDRWIATLSLLVLGAVLVTNAFGRDVLSFGFLASPESISAFRDAWTAGGSEYLGWVTFRTWIDVILFAPVGAFYFLFVPFPWQIHNSLALLAGLENLVLYWPVALLAVPAIRTGWDGAKARILIVFLVAAALAFGLIEGNVGTALRHRAQFTWIVFVFAGPTLLGWWDRSVTRDDGAVPS